METLIPADTEIINLRAKNQLTLPDALAKQVGAEPGDRFRAWVQEDGTIVLRKCRDAYGKYPGMWGATTEETVAHIRELRDEWERDRPWY
jgi:bifunctional DNA-binding transcriptional regulator/antitoxin component of YhaV-PrlF toxin-antitoxin module